jgi:hypothetical protein
MIPDEPGAAGHQERISAYFRGVIRHLVAHIVIIIPHLVLVDHNRSKGLFPFVGCVSRTKNGA